MKHPLLLNHNQSTPLNLSDILCTCTGAGILKLLFLLLIRPHCAANNASRHFPGTPQSLLDTTLSCRATIGNIAWQSHGESASVLEVSVRALFLDGVSSSRGRPLRPASRFFELLCFLSHCWWRYRSRMLVFSVVIT